MSSAETPQLLGVGLYSVPDVATLVQLPPSRVRRWIKGYSFTDRAGGRRRAGPLFRHELPPVAGHDALTFLDLVEVLFVGAFLKHGVSLQTVRRAATVGAELFGTTHPFCVKRFETDGRTIFARITDEVREEHLLDLVRRQAVFRQVFDPLLRQLDYDQLSGDAVCWWPLGKGRPIVVSPRRALGAPATARSAVPTRALYAAHLAGETPKDIASWYQAPEDEVRAAIEFERAQAA